MARQQFIDQPHELSDLVHAAIQRQLAATGRRIKADIYDGDVVLTGVVNTWYQKQVAQESILAIEQVGVVDNRITVDDESMEFDSLW